MRRHCCFRPVLDFSALAAIWNPRSIRPLTRRNSLPLKTGEPFLAPVVWVAELSAVKAVAEIPEARKYVFLDIERTVVRGSMDHCASVLALHLCYALGRTHDADERRIHCSIFFQNGQGLDGAATRGEHGIDSEDMVAGQRGELTVIAARFRCLVVAFKANVADADVGEQIGKGLQHTEAGPQDWNDNEWSVSKDAAGDRLKRCVDHFVFGSDLAGSLDGEEQADLVGERAKGRGLRGFVAEVRDDVRGEGMGKDV